MSDIDQLRSSLFNELLSRFPEVPPEVVDNLIIQNHYDRIRCIEAMARESTRYLYDNNSDAPNTSGVVTTPINKVNDGASQFPVSGYTNEVAGYASREGHYSHPSTPRNYVPSAVSFQAGYPANPRQTLIHVKLSKPQSHQTQHHYNQNFNNPNQNSRQFSHPPLNNPQTQVRFMPSHYYDGGQQYPEYYNSPPKVQRPYSHESPLSDPHAVVSRPLGFNESFPVRNLCNEEASGSPSTPSSQQGGYSNRGTPNTPENCNAVYRPLEYSPNEQSTFSNSLQTSSSYDQSNFLQQQYSHEPPSQRFSNPQSGQAIQQQQAAYTHHVSHMYIPPQSGGSLRTPSPSQPNAPTTTKISGFYQVRGPPSLTPQHHVQSLPPFTLNKQFSSSSSGSSPGNAPMYPGHQTPNSNNPSNHYHHNNPHSSFNLQRMGYELPKVEETPSQPSGNNSECNIYMSNVKNETSNNSDTSYNPAANFPNDIVQPYNNQNNFNNMYGMHYYASDARNNYAQQYLPHHHSSEQSRIEELQRPRSGSIEDSKYIQTLLKYQSQRKEKLNEDLQDSFTLLNKLKGDVSSMEKDMLARKKSRTNYTVTADDIQKIRQENRRLQVDIQLLTREIDIVNNGQAPLGVLDTHQLQNFYKNIVPGQQVHTVHSNNSSRPSTPPPRNPPPRPPPPIGKPLDVHLYQHGVSRPPPQLPLEPSAAAAINNEEEGSNEWNCSACTFANHHLLDKCEMCEMPRLTGSNSGY